jgi:hypothetical protein
MKMALQKLDYKKEYKDLYMPHLEPSLIRVPMIPFLMVDGQGDPNEEGGEYHESLEVLYALTFTIKMSKMGGLRPAGYFEYVVPPLEGLWRMREGAALDLTQKGDFCFTSMIRQPEFVTPEVFEWAVSEVRRKKPELDTSRARWESFEEGLCVQAMHMGSFADEPATLAKMEEFIREQGLVNDIGSFLPTGQRRLHHEIYLGDPRKTAPDKLRTVLRHPVREG